MTLAAATLGSSSEAIHIIVKTGSEFTAPASDGMTRPDGDTGSYFMWLGATVSSTPPATTFRRTLPSSRRSLLYQNSFPHPGGRYYFDLSAMDIPGTANSGNSDGAVSLPDTSLHYVPFTYAGTIEAYKAHVCDGNHRGVMHSRTNIPTACLWRTMP